MPPQVAQNPPVAWQVSPATLADDKDSVLCLTFGKSVPYAKLFRKIFDSHSFESNGTHFTIDYASTRRIIGCAARFVRDATDSSLLDFVLDPDVISTVLAELHRLELLSEDCRLPTVGALQP